MRSLVPRFRSLVAGLPLLALGFALTQIAPAAEPLARPVAAKLTATEVDKTLLDDVKDKSELMKNLEYLSDTIGPRLTGSKNLERANEWTAAKMKEYGLENVKLEPWEIPLGWERGNASMTIVEPDTKVRCVLAAAGWSTSTNGKVVGEVIVLKARNKDDLAQYKGKLKNAVILRNPPATVAPVTDPAYGPLPPAAPKKDEPKKDLPKKSDAVTATLFGFRLASQPLAKEQPKKEEPKQPEPKKDDQPRRLARAV